MQCTHTTHKFTARNETLQKFPYILMKFTHRPSAIAWEIIPSGQ